MALIEFKNVTKQYFTGLHVINALDGASFEINEGEYDVLTATRRNTAYEMGLD